MVTNQNTNYKNNIKIMKNNEEITQELGNFKEEYL